MAQDAPVQDILAQLLPSTTSQQHHSSSRTPDPNHHVSSISIGLMGNSVPKNDNSSKSEQSSAKVESKPRSRGRSILDEIAAQSGEDGPASGRSRPSATSQTVRYDPVTGQPLSRRRSRRDRQTTHQTIPESPTHESAMEIETARVEGVASLTSASTISPISVPEYPQHPEQFPTSPPLMATSPVEIPEPSFRSPKQPSITRSSVGDRNGSLRRSGRRSSVRTGSHSMSPAGAFLSQWSKDDYFMPAEPDDEGQEIGDNGEYIIGRQLGFGGFSVVKEAFTIQDSDRVRRAVKIVRKHINGRSEQENEQVQSEFEHEVSIWRCLNSIYILPLIAVFDSPFATFCITQYNSGGTLFDLIRRQRRAHLSEIDLKSKSATDSPGINSTGRRILPLHHVKRYIFQIASAIRYLHQDVRIVHRDIKLENCLVDVTSSLAASMSSLSASVSSLTSLMNEPSNHSHSHSPSISALSEPANILLCDFGMANFISREDREAFIPTSTNGNGSDRDRSSLDGAPARVPHNIGPGPVSANMASTTNVPGSLPYASPELIRATEPLYDPSIDIWAFGVVCYALLTGDLPFSHGLAAKVQSMISKGEWDQGYVCMCTRNVVRGERDPGIDEDKEVRDMLDLLRGCLDMDAQARWDISQILQCSFLENGTELYDREP